MATPHLHVDTANHRSLVGWAVDPKDPQRPVMLELRNGSVPVARVLANRPRPDLVKAGLGDGTHGFEISVPSHLAERGLLDLRLHDAESGVELYRLTLSTGEPLADMLRGMLLDHVPSLLAGINDPKQRVAQALPLLEIMLGGATRAYQDLQALLGMIQAAPLPGALGFEGAMRQVLDRFAPVRLPDPGETPDISVIIPVFNKFNLTYDCVASLVETAPKASYEVIIVDDGSADETLLASLLLQGARVIRNSSNLGFLRSCNAGAAKAKGRYLHFLNNDTLLKPAALDALVDVFRTRPLAGIAGSKLVFPDGTLQEAGGIIWQLGDGWNWGRGGDPKNPRFDHVRNADYVSGASLMIPAELFAALDGFDETFAPAYYEDTDLCFRVRAAGREVIYQPRSEVVHLEGQSSGTDTAGSGAKRFQPINGRKFLMRWRETLASHGLNGHRADLECDRTAKFRVLFLDQTYPTPGEDAGSRAAWSHMEAIQALGGKISFAATDNMAPLPEAQALRDAGIEAMHHGHYWSVEEILRKRGREFDAIYIHRHGTAARHMATCRGLAPRARIIFNVADLHYLRMEREAALNLPGAADAATLARLRESELLLAQQADAVITHSAVEAELLTAEGVAHCVTVPWVMAGEVTPAGFAERMGCLFVGGFRHQPNVDAMEWFLAEVWPLVRRKLRTATLSVVGSHMPPGLRALDGKAGVSMLGWVEDLQPLYETHRISVAPLRFGAGLKGKVAESLVHGVPCVGTPVAFEGFNLVGMEGLIGDEPAGLARQVIRLLSNDAAWDEARLAGLEYADTHFTAAAVRAGVARAMLPESLNLAAREAASL
jgi:O-antigen biosynthesis protein